LRRYTKGWLGYGDWLNAISAFLFVIPKGGPFGGGQPVKVAKVGGPGMAIQDDFNGPVWG